LGSTPVESSGQALEQIDHHGGDGGVVLGSEPAGLAIEVIGDGYGDVSDVSHGLAFLMELGCAGLLFPVCAKWM